MINLPSDNNHSEAMLALITQLFPICRSITGNGVRQTLKILRQTIPLKTHEVASGTKVLDWTVPPEWNIRAAYIKGPDGHKIVDWQESNLHVVSYSEPIHRTMPLSELQEHLFSDPEHPQVVPYRTSYYKKTWGFCLSHEERSRLAPGQYEVVIDSSLEPGHLTYGEFYHRGQEKAEILISTHICHPSLANDNLSGIAIATQLAQTISQQKTRYSYRFLFIPGTIGSITWLAKHREQTANIKHGLVLACLGDSGELTYKRTRQEGAEIDQAIAYVFQHLYPESTIRDFSPYGYDERQYCSPGFNLPVGCLMRTPDGEYPEYHTSADNLGFIKQQSLTNSLRCCLQVFSLLEDNHYYLNNQPYGEPQLGRRGLYDTTGGAQHDKNQQMAMLWLLNYADGEHSLLNIANKSSLPFHCLAAAAERLKEAGLLTLG